MNWTEAFKKSSFLMLLAIMGGILGALISNLYDNYTIEGSLFIVVLMVSMIFVIAVFMKYTDSD